MTPKTDELLQAFTRACLDVFGEARVIGVFAHGSVIKGGAIPGFSDADLMVFLTPDSFKPGPETDLELQPLPDEDVFALQDRIGSLPWREAGIAHPQANFYDPARMPAWWTGPVPGAYRVLYGRLPDGLEATADRLRASSERFLRDLPRLIQADVRNFADSTDEQIPRRLRLIMTSVTPAIFCLPTLHAADARALWANTKFDALRQLSRLYQDEPGPVMANDLYDRLRAIYSAPSFDTESGREAFKLAVRFLRWVEGKSAAAL